MEACIDESRCPEELVEDESIKNWDDWKEDESDTEPSLRCLFCDTRWNSAECLLEHCHAIHLFNFQEIRKLFQLDFYESIKLINYIRAQVASNKCWSCGLAFASTEDLQGHMHSAFNFEKNGTFPWKDDFYLSPFMKDDALLHSFTGDEDDLDDDSYLIEREELLKELRAGDDFVESLMEDNDGLDVSSPGHNYMVKKESMQELECMASSLNLSCSKQNIIENGTISGKNNVAFCQKLKNENGRVAFSDVIAREVKSINDSYFGAYSSFGIHREMISDKMRTESYREAILNNPSLMRDAIVMDVGCGTGILSLFAAQAGASRVYAVEASEKMAAVASQIAKDNGLLFEQTSSVVNKKCVISVMNSMVEELGESMQFPPHRVDVIVSEWMGYCLLNESMLSSVLFARDHWLKPGGAILPDSATIFAAGFGKGATDIRFWENVYEFNMSSIGREVLKDAAQTALVDIVDGSDIVTGAKPLKMFDLVTMDPEDVDFTSTVELEAIFECLRGSNDTVPKIVWCYGIVLWFESAFSSRFCHENPCILSTSPYENKTHWLQTILTFREPIALTSSDSITEFSAAVGTEACPAVRIISRISIARSPRHRSIDISAEASGVSLDNRERHWPAQIFTL